MVLQDRYKKQASRRYQRAHATELTEEDTALQAALDEADKRRLGSNAHRYREDDDQLAKANGDAGPSAGPAGAAGQGAEDEVDEEEEARKAAELTELEDFRSRQREQLLQQPSRPDSADDDDDDVDHSFAHLRIGGVKGRPRVKSPVSEDGDEVLKAMQDEARRTQAIRDIKDRFAGDARPLPSSSSSSSARPPTLPPKPGAKTVKGGQDFLDMLL
ncbi:hypothetical protein JCM11641_007749 [Rhodosporidiobolus odoratus]